MKAGWRLEPLAAVCQIKPPKAEARRLISANDLVSFVPMEALGIDQKILVPTQTRPLSEVAGSYTYFADGDVLLAKITPCFENGKLGIAANLVNGIGFGSSEYLVFRPDASLDKEWLYYFLARESFRAEGAERMTGAVGHKRVAKDFIEAYPIPVPPLPEQQRIVTLLDEAFDSIATAKANAVKNLQNARDLVSLGFQAITESLGRTQWPTQQVDALIASHKGAMRTGPFGSQLLHSEFVDEGIAVLGIDNAVANEFRWDRRRFISKEKYQQMARYRVFPGDVLITIMGTCGRCAVVPDDIPIAINTKHLCCITLDRKKCLPEYLHIYFLYDPTARDYLNAQAKGSIMAGLNMGIISDLPVRLPLVEVQAEIIDRFDSLRSECDRLESTQKQKLTALDELKKSLLHQAFSGAL
ncbi:restriction endonuclease subunit S [Rhodoferax sp. U11-2br]|uniref:restriction endonuclease subunit S n=1 Tax=Rhodoferax sp. U11-2br TaxID=2838878 RepID=UPI001BEBDCE6|nr:restriction endonuclease subunit S [Rhodoferax sp. U11-2br]MBT3068399.1 restriction endonuclease subunit S [Rhodoferax sp. U11-2br]